jgi:DNA-binding response OmpR family regulator
MKRALLIGQDPLFAWALEKSIVVQGYRLEHVYTLTEAFRRIQKFQYDLYLLDGLSEQEIRSFYSDRIEDSSVVVLDDMNAGGTISELAGKRRIRKEEALTSILSRLGSN